LEKVLGADEDIKVDPIKRGEVLMIVIATMASAGVVIELGKISAHWISSDLFVLRKGQ